ncbi:hypothetical protein AB0R01_30715 [Streptomyces rochei]|uniref:hypothetical protein n=1 Tax=Streptomyces rochei TaxID=1928 RepID=UPI00343A4E05
MDLNRTPSTIASAAAEEVRALNHRTLDTSVFTQPAQVSDTAFGISTTLERLPQALEQLEAALTQLQLAGSIRLTSKPLGSTTVQEVDTEIATAVSALSEARRNLRQAHTAMRQATNVLANLGGLWDDDETEATV